MKILDRKLGLIALLVLPMMAGAAPNDAVAIVNGKPIKQSTLDFLAKQSANGGQKLDDNAKRNLLEVLINREVLAQEAEKAAVDKTPEFTTRLELLRQEALASTYLRDNIKKPAIDDATLRAEYDKLKQRLGTKEYNVRQIAVATEEEAKALITQLSKGSDFAALAKEKSIDQVTKDKGGSIGWVIPAEMRRPFGNIIDSLPKGLYTTVPVQTAGGWVILKIDDIRDKEPPTFEKVKDQLALQLQQEHVEEVIKGLRGKAKVTNNFKSDSPVKK